MAKAPRFEDFDVPGFCAWVRACADAQSLPGLAPTHRCPACGAFWRQCDDASWNLRSASCCGLCDAGRVELVCWLDEPKREPLSDEQLASLYLRWDERPGVSFVDLMRAVEREAYRRAAAECRAVAVDFRRTGNQCTDGRYDWKADSAEDCAVEIEALGSEE